MRCKICGITNLEDALHAIQAGADALGFVFYPPSARYVTPKTARQIIDQLPPFVEKVGLFVEATADEINAHSRQSGIGLVQLHFETTAALQASLELPFIEVIRAQSKEDLRHLNPHRYYLVDSFTQSYGGSGKRLNLEWFEGMDCSRMILAGGLNPDNLAEIRPYGFYGVDVSSGTEAAPGKKDPQKVTDFITMAKS